MTTSPESARQACRSADAKSASKSEGLAKRIGTSEADSAKTLWLQAILADFEAEAEKQRRGSLRLRDWD